MHSDNSAGAEAGGLTSPVPVRDRLEYMADMLLELQDIASDCGCATLSGLLALSHAEALRQAREHP